MNSLDEAFLASETGLPGSTVCLTTKALFSDQCQIKLSSNCYRAKPESITAAASGTSWLGDNAENALLYGSIVEAYTFMKGEADLMQVYEGRFQESVERLRNLGSGLDTRDDYRNGQLRIPAS